MLKACAFLDMLFTTRENPIRDQDGVKAWGVSLWLGEEGEDFVLNQEEGSYAILLHEGFASGSAWLSDAGHGSAVYLDWPYYEASGTGMMVKTLGIRDILMPQGVTVPRTNLLTLDSMIVKEVYNPAWLKVKDHVARSTAAFITGQQDIETGWQDYIDRLYYLGLEDIIYIYQEALDSHNAG